MLHTSRPRQRRQPARVLREPKQAQLHRRERERRFVPAEDSEWHARQCAQERARKALHKHGVLIRLRLVPRADASLLEIGQAVEALRREGFIIWSDDNALILNAEPTLAITFMDIACGAHVLSADLCARLKTILKSATWLRARNRQDILQTAPAFMPLFASIEAPA